MTEYLPPVVNGRLILEEDKDIYEPFWQFKKKEEFKPTLFVKFSIQRRKEHRGKGARLTFA
jgi:hypothetical protein